MPDRRPGGEGALVLSGFMAALAAAGFDVAIASLEAEAQAQSPSPAAPVAPVATVAPAVVTEVKQLAQHGGKVTLVGHSFGGMVALAGMLAERLAEVGITDWQSHVRQDQKFFRPAEVDLLIGDPSKAQDKLGWTRDVDFATLVKMMVANDLRIESAKR